MQIPPYFHYKNSSSSLNSKDFPCLSIVKPEKAKKKWTKEEDDQLKKVVFCLKECFSWKNVSIIMNNGRTAGQCRERYANCLLNKEGKEKITVWTKEEKGLLYRLAHEKGNKWTEISKEIQSKSVNEIKNCYYSSIRSRVKEIIKSLANKDKEFALNLNEKEILKRVNLNCVSFIDLNERVIIQISNDRLISQVTFLHENECETVADSSMINECNMTKKSIFSIESHENNDIDRKGRICLLNLKRKSSDFFIYKSIENDDFSSEDNIFDTTNTNTDSDSNKEAKEKKVLLDFHLFCHEINEFYLKK